VAAYAFDRWLALLEHPPSGAVPAAAVVAMAAGAALLRAGRRTSRGQRAAAGAATGIAALAALLVVCGVPASDLDPRAWKTLLRGVGDGLAALPGLTVPYRGAEPWASVVLAFGGGLLTLGAVAAAAWPRRPAGGSRMTAVAVLAVLYAVPAVELTDPHPWRAGAVFTLGIAAVLYAERLRPREAPLAVAAVLVAVCAGLVLAPRLDAGAPLIDVQELATSLEGRGGLRFSWDHSYGPLGWPRDGRVVARVSASVGAYWKAETLEGFDGTAWVASLPTGRPAAGDPTPVREWRQRIRVSIGALQTRQFLGAGTTTYVWNAPRKPVSATAGSYVSASGPLVDGDAYRALVYYPRPTEHQLRTAGFDYPADTQDLGMTVRGRRGVTYEVQFPRWGLGDGAPQERLTGVGLFQPDGAQLLARSAYAPVYALAQRLRARSGTPYAYVTAVQRYLQQGFAYDESPPRARDPLVTFLFGNHRGYCQHFSGAMALLLRMGGVPTRVAAGFSPGTPASTTGEFVVRDLDAHSWVEALFPGIGWVTFDPTPQIAPAASQIGDAPPGAVSPAGDRPGPTGRNADAGGPAPGGGAAAGGGGPWWRSPLAIVTAVLALAAACALATALRLERRRHPPTAPELAELERALRRAGRDPRPPTTLRDLERLLGPDDDATAYVRAVRDARYAGHGEPPTPAERRALRRALGDGLGITGRVRALWALPPRPSRQRPSLH
jgi:transglutaminase-like putative cysteine protease